MEPQILSLLGEYHVEDTEEKIVNPFESLLLNAPERESDQFAERIWRLATGKSIDGAITEEESSIPLTCEFPTTAIPTQADTFNGTR